jgi:Uma2 family endonuclease
MNDMAVEYQRRLITVEEYRRMFAAGVFDERDRLELIGGELIEMPPIGQEHAGRHARISQYLITSLSGSACVVPMGSFRLGDHSEPQPDLAILPYVPDFYERRRRPPVSAFLGFVEIAESSLAFDRGPRMRLYARYGLRDYLIVDLRNDRLIVHRDPTPDGYATIAELGHGRTFSLTQLPDVELAADPFLTIRS